MLTALTCLMAASGPAQTPEGASPPARAPSDSGVVTITSPQHVLREGDIVQVKVYQEEDLTSVSRIGKEGAITMPLLGSVKVLSNTLEKATVTIHDLLAKGYLVNPQVTLNVNEFAKRRFTVLGQVQRPGTYDMPGDDAVSLLQAIATAGGYARGASARKITVQRMVGKENRLMKLDAEAMARDKDKRPFEILPDDVILIGEKWF